MEGRGVKRKWRVVSRKGAGGEGEIRCRVRGGPGL